ncbi:hypothetical protein C8A05DRAFT_14442 [Staphylotrichum tortipilum]|uniref:Cytochrome P450 monooxygenase n=1 Tax=Staphylotrichum tortipilum TaxID=2831512 RepID=A0AAN6RVH3_9PEZI|nr:hypothetical protein C8A05DRAFT_14442 [Staphylotrichum longicolle]
MGVLNPDVATLLGVPPAMAWPLAASVLAILLATGYVLYNIFSHRLHRVPGPVLWAATDVPYVLAWLSGRAQFTIHDLHKRYGDVVRIGPNRLSFTDPDAWHEIRGHRKNGQGEHGKDLAFYSIAKGNILGADRADHARFRRILSHGFSAKSMQDQQPLITYYVDLLMQRLAERTRDDAGNSRDAVVNLGAWFNFTTFDVIGDLAFGEPFGCLEDSRYHPWVKTIFDGIGQIGVYMTVQWYCPWVMDLTKKLFPRGYIGDKIEQQSQYTRAKLEKRLALGASRPDFVEAMITAKSEDGRTMTKEQLVLHGRVLVLAGSETTATVLSGTAFMLALNPDAQKKLAEEVRSTFSSVEEIDLFSVNKLRYMLAVLDESMRMFPPVPSQLPRVCRTGGDVICGYHVPEGTSLEIWGWAMNYSTNNFTEPEKFIPERWLAGDEYQGVRFDKRRHHALQPFSVGPRNCIGKNLAYVEMRLILARLIWDYDFVLADEASERMLDSKAFSLWLKGPLNMRLIPVARG